MWLSAYFNMQGLYSTFEEEACDESEDEDAISNTETHCMEDAGIWGNLNLGGFYHHTFEEDCNEFAA